MEGLNWINGLVLHSIVDKHIFITFQDASKTISFASERYADTMQLYLGAMLGTI